MLSISHESIFRSTAQVLVNPVNTMGVMGKGLAADVRARYPDVYERYRAVCKAGLLKPGKLQLIKTQPHWILNFPTKVHYHDPSLISWIEMGLSNFANTYVDRGIQSASFPLLGCGLGGLSREHVIPLMRKYLEPLQGQFLLHTPPRQTSTAPTSDAPPPPPLGFYRPPPTDSVAEQLAGNLIAELMHGVRVAPVVETRQVPLEALERVRATLVSVAGSMSLDFELAADVQFAEREISRFIRG